MLPDDYNDQDGEEAAELIIREAIAACFLATSAKFGFTDDLVHARPRFPRTDAKWLEIGTIADPDTIAASTDEGKARLTRYFSVKFRGFRRALRQLTLRYDIVISFGFKDEYLAPALAGQNSHDQLAGCSVRFGRYLADNLNLGLDDRVTHTFLEIYNNDTLRLDKQGNAAEILYGRLDVTLEVC